ncbi:hypothetical protein QBC38DRAFT_459885 [Podospora fimiseda]|uniref:Uncharacterized protein n=1 Tax=Podospora fimiseda TaxID=252190 RepID=A0AAN7BEK3_9PEZI|nr:hypothetical protein QBC38DRAFT_459885 [Podospora fimiseda]
MDKLPPEIILEIAQHLCLHFRPDDVKRRWTTDYDYWPITPKFWNVKSLDLDCLVGFDQLEQLSNVRHLRLRDCCMTPQEFTNFAGDCEKLEEFSLEINVNYNPTMNSWRLTGEDVSEALNQRRTTLKVVDIRLHALFLTHINPQDAHWTTTFASFSVLKVLRLRTLRWISREFLNHKYDELLCRGWEVGVLHPMIPKSLEELDVNASCLVGDCFSLLTRKKNGDFAMLKKITLGALMAPPAVGDVEWAMANQFQREGLFVRWCETVGPLHVLSTIRECILPRPHGYRITSHLHETAAKKLH